MKKPKDINPVTAPQLAQQVAIQRFVGSPLMVFGPSGVGKTTIMAAAAAKHFDEVWVTNGAGKGPIDFTGLGLPRHDGKILNMDFSQPGGIPTIERVGDKHVYWLLDEFGNWEDEVRAAFHGVLSPPAGDHRYLGTHIIGPNVRVGLTSNLRHHGAAVGRFTIPEMIRNTIVTFIPDPADWWQWADGIADYSSTFVPAFIAYGNSVGAKAEHKNHFLGSAEDFDPLAPNPFPNPRSWEQVMKLFVTARTEPIPKEAVRVFVEGRVGVKAASALRAFLGVMQSAPAFEAMRSDPKGYVVPDGVDKQFMLASGAMLYAVRDITDVHAALHGGKFDWLIDGMARLKPEVAAYGLTAADRRGIKVSERNPQLWTELVGR